MKTKDLCRRLISLMEIMNPKGKKFYAYKDKKTKKLIFGWKGKTPEENIMTRGMAIYLVMKGK